MLTEAIQKDIVKARDGRFVKGQVANPRGSNGYTTVKTIEQALNKKAKRKGFKNFPAYVAERALINDAVLVAVLKKIVPDQIEGKGFASNLRQYIIIRADNSKAQSEAGPIRI